MVAQTEQVIDLAFALRGTLIPADHGYPLYAALSRCLPALHGDEAIGVHPVRGRLVGQRRLALTPASRLVLRLPYTKVPEAIRLAGRRLDLNGDHVMVGVPATQALRPAAALASRLVVIRGFTEEEPFLDAVRRQLDALEMHGTATLLQRQAARAIEGQSAAEARSPVRRTLRIHDKEVVGFAVRVERLTVDESIRLQEAGLGGRRRFGCGVFVPVAPGGQTG